jgi:MSHA biogenesis protein MshN
MSVINKMLNDLDQRKDSEQAQKDVAFLQPAARKNAPKWMIGGVVSIVLGILALVVSYMYYAQVLGLNKQRSQDKVNVQAQQEKKSVIPPTEASQTKSPTTAAQIKETIAEQPELIVITNKNTSAKPDTRKSTLSVSKAPDATQLPAKQAEPEKKQPVTPSRTNLIAKASVQPELKSSVAPLVSAVKTSSDEPRPQGLPSADSQKMKVSRVKLSTEQRAEKAYAKAKMMSRSGLIKTAIKQYKNVLQLQPSHQQGRSELAALYYGRQMVTESIGVLEQGLSIDSSNSGWSLLAAKIHYKRGDYVSAAQYLQLPLSALDDAQYIALKATTLQKLKDYQGAQAAYQQLTLSFADNGRWWLGLGTSLEGLGQNKAAIAAYSKSLRLSNISQTSRQFIRSRLMKLEN